MSQQSSTTRGTVQVVEKTLGTRTILNTNFGRTASVERHQYSNRPYWTVQVVCNGIADYREQFSTRREAMNAYDTLGAQAE